VWTLPGERDIGFRKRTHRDERNIAMAGATLRPKHERRVAAGHLWIYQGNIERIEGDPAPGDVIDVFSARGEFLGRGYYNPHSQIAIRLLTRDDRPIDHAFFAERIRKAQAWRARVMPDQTSYRLIYSEGDLLPGLIVDRYEDVLVVQFLTLGMEVRRDEIIAALEEVVEPRAVFERSDVASRRHEGLEPRVGLLRGELPPQPMTITENGLAFEVDVVEGQKTGYFLDQKVNRTLLAPLVEGARVLDVFCHTGSFSVHALHYGAREVTGIDSSEQAVAAAQRNVERNGLGDRARFEVANAFDRLRELEREGERFDCVILDPPAFAKGKAHVEAAARGYKEVNLRALKLLEPGGFLVTCSCSHHMSPDEFYAVVLDAALDARKHLRVVDTRGQAPDHPVLAGVPETAYLKCFIFQVI